MKCKGICNARNVKKLSMLKSCKKRQHVQCQHRVFVGAFFVCPIEIKSNVPFIMSSFLPDEAVNWFVNSEGKKLAST